MKNAPKYMTLVVGLLIGSLGTYTYLQSMIKTDQNDLSTAQTDSGLGAEQSEETNFVWHYSNLYNEFIIAGETEKSRFYGPVIYSAHVVYSDYFAKEYGYPTSYVAASLPSYIDYVEFEMKYAGRFNQCNIKLLVDKDGPVQIPEEPVYRPFAGSSLNMMLAALPRRQGKFSEKNYQRQYRLSQHEYDGSKPFREMVHGSFAILGRDEGPSSEYGSVSLNIDIAKPNIFSEWTFISLRTGCSEVIKNIVDRQAVNLLMRPKGEGSSAAMIVSSTEKFLSFELPMQLIDPVRRDFQKISFNHIPR